MFSLTNMHNKLINWVHVNIGSRNGFSPVQQQTTKTYFVKVICHKNELYYLCLNSKWVFKCEIPPAVCVDCLSFPKIYKIIKHGGQTWMGHFEERHATNHPCLVIRIFVLELYHHWFREWVSPVQHQTITEINTNLLPIWSLGTSFICIWIRIQNFPLTHWGRVTHICISKLTIIGSDNGLSPGQCQAIIWTNAGILLIRTSGTNFSEILSGIHAFLFKKMHLKMSSAKWRPFCLGLNVLTEMYLQMPSENFSAILFQLQYVNPEVTPAQTMILITLLLLFCHIISKMNLLSLLICIDQNKSTQYRHT